MLASRIWTQNVDLQTIMLAWHDIKSRITVKICIEQTCSLTFDELATKLLISIAEVIKTTKVVNSQGKLGFVVDCYMQLYHIWHFFNKGKNFQILKEKLTVTKFMSSVVVHSMTAKSQNDRRLLPFFPYSLELSLKWVRIQAVNLMKLCTQKNVFTVSKHPC